jgi:glycosyltransferase involved in cell wall biosynthesis
MRPRLARLARAVGAARAGPAAPSADLAAVAGPLARLAREGPAPLRPPSPSVPEGPLELAVVVPHFRRGSGGHRTISNLVRGLEARGHRCAIVLHDPLGQSGGPAAFEEFFGPFAGPVHASTADVAGADVALATGWQTVAPVLLLEGCGARAYLVQDHEPEFYPASAERLWAAEGYRRGLPCITAGAWLADVMAGYGASASPFDLGIDHDAYRPGPDRRRDARVLFYARAATPRRAVPLGLLALAELHRRRPEVELALFGDPAPPAADFPFEHLGVLDDPGLARAYRQATVGVVLSLTNHSLVAQEMVACGLPAVELDGPSTRAAFGDVVELAPPDPLALAGAIERLLDDPALRARREEAGLRWAAQRTWTRAAGQVEDGLRAALAAQSPAGEPNATRR